MQTRQYCILLVLVKDGFTVRTRTDLMDTETASVWLEVEIKGKNNLMIGAIYREHSLIRQIGKNMTSDPALQQQRWKVFLKQWKKVESQHDTSDLAKSLTIEEEKNGGGNKTRYRDTGFSPTDL